ncbi:MAG: anhydro-N-acetylmuramic acid kinase [Burkholderiales bacterium]
MSGGLYLGLMSGTSLDGADAVLVDFSGPTLRLLADAHHTFDTELKRELLALNTPGTNEIERAALAGNALARAYADAVAAVLQKSSVPAQALVAIGCHGQTVRHRPESGFTVQLGNAALLAELSSIRVVADFRSRDIAAGGQGAPLAPAFHAAVFSSPDENRVALNLGGIANLSVLPRSGPVIGFDSGPGNCLLDLWASLHLGRALDDGGSWAAGAKPIDALLEKLLADPYFAAAPPKSTGRDLFNEPWLRRMLRGGEEPQAVQATLLELTARSIADATRKYAPTARRLIACGGGVKNDALMRRLAQLVIPATVETSSMHGVDPQLVEAAAFAWLAWQALEGRAGNLPSVTGARGPRVLGSVYPA